LEEEATKKIIEGRARGKHDYEIKKLVDGVYG
jgi:hypothetical protein